MKKEFTINFRYAEMFLWSFLYMNRYGYVFRRHYPVGPVIADFYCHALKMIIQIDSHPYTTAETAWPIDIPGIQVFRFTDISIIHDPEDMNMTMDAILKSRSSDIPPADDWDDADWFYQ